MSDQVRPRLNIVPGSVRDTLREKQMEAIRAAVRLTYAPRIRAAANRKERRELKAECNAQIARRTYALLREREQDGPHCL